MELDRDFFTVEEAFSLGDIAEEVSSRHPRRVVAGGLTCATLTGSQQHNIFKW